MSMKPLLFSVVLAFASNTSAAPKAPKAPKAERKKEAELKGCQAQLNALSGSSTPEEKSSVAQCQFWLAEQGYAKFTALKLPKTFDKDKLAKWLEDSEAQRQDTSALYVKVKGLDNKEQSVAALARLGLISYQFATNIQRATTNHNRVRLRR